MKILALILLSVSVYASVPTSCNAKYKDLEIKSESFSKSSNGSPTQIMTKAIELDKLVYGYLTTCCKTQECKDEMYESLHELDQIIKITSIQIKRD